MIKQTIQELKSTLYDATPEIMKELELSYNLSYKLDEETQSLHVDSCILNDGVGVIGGFDIYIPTGQDDKIEIIDLRDAEFLHYDSKGVESLCQFSIKQIKQYLEEVLYHELSPSYISDY